jgi:hypothetical protein
MLTVTVMVFVIRYIASSSHGSRHAFGCHPVLHGHASGRPAFQWHPFNAPALHVGSMRHGQRRARRRNVCPGRERNRIGIQKTSRNKRVRNRRRKGNQQDRETGDPGGDATLVTGQSDHIFCAPPPLEPMCLTILAPTDLTILMQVAPKEFSAVGGCG